MKNSGEINKGTGKTTAVILAGGSGSRMGSAVKKQFMELDGKPLIAHTLQVFQTYAAVDEIVLVASAVDSTVLCGTEVISEIEFIRKHIVDKYGFTKVKAVVPGGSERYHSVYAGLTACRSAEMNNDEFTETVGKCLAIQEPTYVLIHDGARAFVTKQVLDNVMEGLKKSEACVAAVPVKDTIKKADNDGCITQTVDRKSLYAMQTPQAFSYPLVLAAYSKLIEKEQAGGAAVAAENKALVTDDAMVVEKYYPDQKVILVEGSYENIKVTTPEDFIYGEFLVRRVGNK